MTESDKLGSGSMVSSSCCSETETESEIEGADLFIVKLLFFFH